MKSRKEELFEVQWWFVKKIISDENYYHVLRFNNNKRKGFGRKSSAHESTISRGSANAVSLCLLKCCALWSKWYSSRLEELLVLCQRDSCTKHFIHFMFPWGLVTSNRMNMHVPWCPIFFVKTGVQFRPTHFHTLACDLNSLLGIYYYSRQRVHHCSWLINKHKCTKYFSWQCYYLMCIDIDILPCISCTIIRTCRIYTMVHGCNFQPFN